MPPGERRRVSTTARSGQRGWFTRSTREHRFYYDKPGEKALEALSSWTALYPGAWDGVIATKMAGIGVYVVLTAWTKRLNPERFDRAAAAAFIDLFRGRGPEHPVR